MGRAGYFLLAVLVIAMGLAVRSPGMRLHPAVAEYGGSVLWAAMVYLLVRTISPRWPVPVSALIAAAIALGGEVLQLYSAPWFDWFRGTRIGHLIFGRTFAIEDIAAYWAGIAIAALLEITNPTRDRAQRAQRKSPDQALRGDRSAASKN